MKSYFPSMEYYKTWEVHFYPNLLQKRELIDINTVNLELSAVKCKVNIYIYQGWRKNMEDAILYDRISK